jgi:hypothetical protein
VSVRLSSAGAIIEPPAPLPTPLLRSSRLALAGLVLAEGADDIASAVEAASAAGIVVAADGAHSNLDAAPVQIADDRESPRLLESTDSAVPAATLVPTEYETMVPSPTTQPSCAPPSVGHAPPEDAPPIIVTLQKFSSTGKRPQPREFCLDMAARTVSWKKPSAKQFGAPSAISRFLLGTDALELTRGKAVDANTGAVAAFKTPERWVHVAFADKAVLDHVTGLLQAAGIVVSNVL